MGSSVDEDCTSDDSTLRATSLLQLNLQLTRGHADLVGLYGLNRTTIGAFVGSWEAKASNVAEDLGASRRTSTRHQYNQPTSPQLYECALNDMVEFDVQPLRESSTQLQARRNTRRGKLDRRWAKCAVVSSGGVLAQHEYGRAIDSADLVFRFNDAPLHGYEAIVGSKDDVRIVNDQFPDLVEADGSLLSSNVTYVMVPTNINAEKSRTDFEALHERHPQIEMYIVSSTVATSFTRALHSLYADPWFYNGIYLAPTSGAYGMLLALEICDEVNAYGMAATERTQHSPYHYYDQDSTDANYHASFDVEKDLWGQLASNQESMEETNVVVIPGFASLRTCADVAEVEPIHSAPTRSRWLFTLVAVISIMSFPVLLIYVFCSWSMIDSVIDNIDPQTRRHGCNCLLLYAATLLLADSVNTRVWRTFNGVVPWEPLLLYLVVEILKAAISVVLMLVHPEPASPPHGREYLEASPRGADKTVWLRAAVYQLPIAGLYAANGFILSHLISRVELSGLIYWRNLAIPLNACLWFVCYRKSLTIHQKVGVVAILVGMILLHIRADGSVSLVSMSAFVLILSSVACSCFAATTSDLIMHCPRYRYEVGINGLNLLLYLETAGFLMVIVVVQFLQGFSSTLNAMSSETGAIMIVIIMVQVVLGLAVSRVLFYTDSVAKAVSGCVREVAGVFIAPIFVSARIDWISLAAGAWFAFGLGIYFSRSCTMRGQAQTYWNQEYDIRLK